jgi:hypothetical protein
MPVRHFGTGRRRAVEMEHISTVRNICAKCQATSQINSRPTGRPRPASSCRFFAVIPATRSRRVCRGRKGLSSTPSGVVTTANSAPT